MKHELKPLPYAYDALEPYFDAKTMEIHHSRHHQAYIDKLNAALQDHPRLMEKDPGDLLRHLNEIPDTIRTAVRNHGGGHVNHTMFWSILKNDVPFSGSIAEAVNAAFGSFENFKTKFSTAAVTLFGSGWAWLVLNNGNLEITTTANQDNPISERNTPILGLDVWEHAYYLKFQNRRPEYVESFFNVIDWERVDSLYAAGK